MISPIVCQCLATYLENVSEKAQKMFANLFTMRVTLSVAG